MPKEHEIFIQFFKGRNLKLTHQRQHILSSFLKTNRHLSVEELYDIVKKEDPAIGQVTVFSTMKLLREADLAKVVNLGDKKVRYEQKDGHSHHDHLVCVKCGKFIETIEPKIEKLQDALCEKFEFSPVEHKRAIYGICKDCKKEENKNEH
jgi:Fur family ferric uptake transcriptional regulator